MLLKTFMGNQRFLLMIRQIFTPILSATCQILPKCCSANIPLTSFRILGVRKCFFHNPPWRFLRWNRSHRQLTHTCSFTATRATSQHLQLAPTVRRIQPVCISRITLPSMAAREGIVIQAYPSLPPVCLNPTAIGMIYLCRWQEFTLTCIKRIASQSSRYQHPMLTGE